MQNPIRTIIFGYTPITNTNGKKPRELRADQYFKDLLAQFDLGEVHFAVESDLKQKLDELNPIVAIVFDEYFSAKTVRGNKKDILIYVTESPGSVFYRKAETEAKKQKQLDTFKEIEGLLKKIWEDGDEKLEATRRFASMSYTEMYEMLKRAIASDDPEMSRKAWELLNSNDVNSSFIWMRAQLIAEVWDAADAKRKEEFLLLAMQDHIRNGFAHKIEDFTDAEGNIYHQFMFHYPDGTDANYIRRIPVAKPDQDKWGYVNLLDRYETPLGPRMMLEVGQAKKLKDEMST